MKRLLIGERNLEDRSVLREIFRQLDPSILLNFAGNGEDILNFLTKKDAVLPSLILLDPSLPSAFSGPLIPIIKADPRFSAIPIVVLAEQARSDYYAARTTGLAAMCFLKPSRPSGWKLLAQRILDLAMEKDSLPQPIQDSMAIPETEPEKNAAGPESSQTPPDIVA